MLGVECSQALEPTWLHYHDAYTLPESPLGDLIRLFSLRASVPRPRVEEIFSANDIEDLSRLGILATDAETVSAKVSMFCSGGLLLVTDHRFMIQPTDGMDEDPVMYIGMDSHGLVQAAPRSRCSRVLDLCCGSGIQGLVATRYAHEVVAVDLNPRAVRFARFNAQLNGIHNYQALQGDLYQAVSDQTFDCILANPPFVPSPEESLGFRDGGPTGENILRSIVEQAWPHLTPGGRLCIVSDLVDIQSYESKLRGWTREEATYGLLLTTADRDEILFSVPHCHAPFSQSYAEYVSNLDRWVENFRRSRMSAVNFGFILLWRREEGAGCDITQRTIHSPTQPIWLQVEDWLDQRRRWDSPDAASMTVSLHPDLRIVTDESPCGDNKACELRVPENPFFTVYPISPAIADELRAIQTNQPNLARISNSREVTPIESLHRLGILRLGSTQKNPNGTTAPQAEGTLDTIVQRATKTTPTCLSNYLH